MYIFYLHLEETATTTDLKSNYKEIDYIKRQTKKNSIFRFIDNNWNK